MTSADSLPMPSVIDNKKPLRLLIIGNGMVGHELVKRLIAAGANQRFDIKIIGEEPRPAYDRVHLSGLLNGMTADDLLLSPTEWYHKNGITLLTDQRVTMLNRAERRVLVDNGEEHKYDFCVLATGSRPFVPPVEGTNLPRVFVYRTIEDLAQIRACAEHCQSAAVMGGGLLGLEAAKGLLDLGLETHVLEMAPGLMPRQLDTDCAKALKAKVEALGVKVHLLRATQRISEQAGQLQVEFSQTDSLRTNMVVISAGIRPRDDLAQEAGLACGTRGGIAVDDHLQTNDPRIYAIGECASFDGRLYGLVGPGYQMASVLAENLAAISAGEPAQAAFTGASEAAQLKLLGVEVATLGIPIGQQDDCVLVSQQTAESARTLMMQRGRVVGAIGVGAWPEREQIADLISQRTRVSSRQIRRFDKTAELRPNRQPVPVDQWSEDATVCSCLNVSRGTLSCAIRDGHDQIEALSATTGASTVCGSCRPLLASLVGATAQPVEVPGWRTLLVASGFAAVLVLGYWAAEPIPFADTVQTSWQKVDFLWRDSFAKQVSGFSILAISVVGLLLSLRKRFNWFQFGSYGVWRSLHSILGVATLVGFLVHTGLRMGHNFTFVLAAVFLSLNFLGAFTGIAAALESRISAAWSQRLRTWRPWLARVHIWLFWPLPALVLFHIISVYYY